MTEKNEKKNKIDRRQFLGLAWLASVVAFTGEALGTLFKFIQPVSDGGFGGMVNAGTLEEFPPGSITLIKEGRFFLSRLDDGSFIALWQRCTHLGCSVPWEEEEDQYHCPCHGSLFDKLGEVTGGPAPRPMDYFPVIIEAGEVFVNTEEAFERKAFDPSQTTHA
ncbi:MAG: Rieske 2Fe-2S domain-containing protein [Anaerolineae bacterium]|nr:Rieske 2Fe-2S domain-containing protein [Anaerolineae bacterium]MBT7191800.1 Rieske 2Fe-2S domain-containing protein [Anaerolineae bacterium]